MKETLARAANILRESLSVDNGGAVFFNTSNPRVPISLSSNAGDSETGAEISSQKRAPQGFFPASLYREESSPAPKAFAMSLAQEAEEEIKVHPMDEKTLSGLQSPILKAICGL